MTITSEQALVERAKAIAKSMRKDWDPRFERILSFCAKDPEKFPTPRRITSLAQINDRFLIAYVTRYDVARNGTEVLLADVGTVKDPVVDEVLKAFANVRPEDLEKTSKAHRLSMQAENIVGTLLEGYVAQLLETKGWIWCCGNTIRAVDFIKEEVSGNVRLLQIKNRDNSENSSSSAIRKGTTIEKWYRVKSKTGKTCWDLLPENSTAGSNQCTEKGFYSYVREVARRRPAIKEVPSQNTDALMSEI